MATIAVTHPVQYGDGVVVSTASVLPRRSLRSDSRDPQLPSAITTTIIQPPTEQVGGIGGASTGGTGSATYWVTG